MKAKVVLKLIVFCIIVGLTPFCIFAAETQDAVYHSYLEQFNELTVSKYASNYYLTREDFCVAISKIFIDDYSGTEELPFEDYEQISPESRLYLSALYKKGILSGAADNGRLYMRPDLNITRQEAITLLGKVLSKSSDSRLAFTDESLIQPYAYGFIAWFTENGIILGYPDGSFYPENRMTAGELAALTIRTLNYTQADEISIETVAGTGSRGHTDGSTPLARFTLPYSIICNKNGDIYVFDTYSNAIRTIKSDKTETITGGSAFLDDNGFSKGFYLDDTLDKALLNRPTDGVLNSNGELLFADSENNVIRHIRGNIVYTFCGTEAGFKDGERDTAKFNSPMAIAIDKNNNIYVADTLNNCIRRIDSNGKVTTIAGTPEKEGYKDGSASSALFRAPAGIAVSDDGSIVYVSDTGNHMIRKIENGQVITIAGTTDKSDDGDPLGGFKDGSANEAMFNLPRGIVSVDGVLIIADSGNNMIRAITKSSVVVTIAGDGDPAALNNPCGVSFYNGQLYIADTGNNKIKKVMFDSGLYK